MGTFHIQFILYEKQNKEIINTFKLKRNEGNWKKNRLSLHKNRTSFNGDLRRKSKNRIKADYWQIHNTKYDRWFMKNFSLWWYTKMSVPSASGVVLPNIIDTTFV